MLPLPRHGLQSLPTPTGDKELTPEGLIVRRYWTEGPAIGLCNRLLAVEIKLLILRNDILSRNCA